MKNIVLDTNFILHCIEFRIDFMQELNRIIDDSFGVYILEKTLQELKGKKQEKLAIALIEKQGIKLIKVPEGVKSVDAALLHLDWPDKVIATQDKALKEKLKKRGIAVITIRQKKYLTLM